jgi:hypothetical protein
MHTYIHTYCTHIIAQSISRSHVTHNFRPDKLVADISRTPAIRLFFRANFAVVMLLDYVYFERAIAACLWRIYLHVHTYVRKVYTMCVCVFISVDMHTFCVWNRHMSMHISLDFCEYIHVRWIFSMRWLSSFVFSIYVVRVNAQVSFSSCVLPSLSLSAPAYSPSNSCSRSSAKTSGHF